MALNFPNTPADGQVFTDTTGQQWVYETTTNSWTAMGQQGGGMIYKGGIDVTTAAPAGAQSGWLYVVNSTGVADASFTGVAGQSITKGSQLIYDGSAWTILEQNLPSATESHKGLVELATAAETTTGTDKHRAVHPAGLKVELDKKVKLAGDTMTGNLTVPSLNGGPLAGFRNLLINGQIYVNQRGSGPFGAGQQYTSDRWRVSHGDQVTVTNGGPLNSNRLVVAGAAVDIAQGVELTPITGRPGPFVQGSVWTVSVWATAAANLSVAFVDTVLNPTNSATVKATGPMTATSETDNGFTKYTATFTVSVAPNPTNNALQIGFSSVTGSIAMVQLEPGPVATPFERRPIGTELALCQRYYETAKHRLFISGSFNDGAVVGTVKYSVTKRASPTVTVHSLQTGNSGFVDVDTTPFAATASGDLYSAYASWGGGARTNANNVLFEIKASAEL